MTSAPICEKTGAATSPPYVFPCGSSTTTAITTRGASAGTKPMNDATYFSFEYPAPGIAFWAVPVLPAAA